MLDGLSYDEARRFVRAATIMILRNGDRLARAGDMAFKDAVLHRENQKPATTMALFSLCFEKVPTVGEITNLGVIPRTAAGGITKDAEVLTLT